MKRHIPYFLVMFCVFYSLIPSRPVNALITFVVTYWYMYEPEWYMQEL